MLTKKIYQGIGPFIGKRSINAILEKSSEKAKRSIENLISRKKLNLTGEADFYPNWQSIRKADYFQETHGGRGDINMELRYQKSVSIKDAFSEMITLEENIKRLFRKLNYNREGTKVLIEDLKHFNGEWKIAGYSSSNKEDYEKTHVNISIAKYFLSANERDKFNADNEKMADEIDYHHSNVLGFCAEEKNDEIRATNIPFFYMPPRAKFHKKFDGFDENIITDFYDKIKKFSEESIYLLKQSHLPPEKSSFLPHISITVPFDINNKHYCAQFDSRK